MSRVSLMGVPFDAVTKAEAVDRLNQMLDDAGQYHVMTPNAEMLVAAHRDPSFHSLLHRSALNLPDSTGVVWMARLFSGRLPERVTGVDTVMALCSTLSSAHGVFLLGGGPGVAEAAAAALKTLNPALTISGTFAGSPKEDDATVIIERIRAASPRLLLVAYGAPGQDQWIDRHLAELPGVRVAMGVGGTFDFLAGRRVRAPQLLQRLGLEWVWRLFSEPRRIGRIFTAVVVFPLLALRFGRGR